MKDRIFVGIALMLALAMLSATSLLASAEAPEADYEELELVEDGEMARPDGEIVPDDELALDDAAAIPDELPMDGLLLDGLLDLQLSEDALLSVSDDAALGLQTDLAEMGEGSNAAMEGSTESVTASGGMDNDALFEGWMRQVLPGMVPRRTQRSAYSGQASLDGVNLQLYDALVPMISDVANGERTSTTFGIDVDAVGLGSWWTAEQLGIDDMSDGKKLGPALLNKADFDSNGIMQALLADCPYALYWYDKTETGGMGWSYSMQIKTEGGVQYGRISVMTANMAVAVDYSKAGTKGTYEVNDLPARVTTAASNIENIVASNAGKDDLAKLRAYANEICTRVEYNDDAARNKDTPYGDPWQLVYIFDDEPGTKVVCEGYSKGFKYLCDLSDLDGDVACELMSGSIPEGAHMWNAVRMPDGHCYPVDLTNSDGGASCNERIFLKACTAQTGISFKCDTLTYTYSEKTLATLSDEWLTMSGFNYGECYTVAGFSGEYDGKAHGVSVSLNGAGVVRYGTEAGSCTLAESPTWKDAGKHTAYYCVKFDGMDEINGKATVNITPKTVGLAWANTSFTYDGKNHAPAATATGLISGDACTVTVTGGRVNAGSYTATASALSNGNYALPSGATQAFTIGKKTVGLSWANTSFTYDGKNHAPAATATGLISGDACTVTVTGGRVNAGSYTATASGLSNANYALPKSAAQAYAIAPKTVGLKWSKTSLTYNGKAQKPTAKATGLVSGDKCTVTVTGSRKNAGKYTAKATKLSNANYALPKARTKACTIKKKTIKLKWTRTKLKYNGKSQKPTATAVGLIKGDKCKVTVSGAKKKRGTYTAKATKLSNANYQMPTKVTVKFRIY